MYNLSTLPRRADGLCFDAVDRNAAEVVPVVVWVDVWEMDIESAAQELKLAATQELGLTVWELEVIGGETWEGDDGDDGGGGEGEDCGDSWSPVGPLEPAAQQLLSGGPV